MWKTKFYKGNLKELAEHIEIMKAEFEVQVWSIRPDVFGDQPYDENELEMFYSIRRKEDE